MIVIPAIDLKDGQCVRLSRGDMQTADVYESDVVAVAKRWAEAGARRIHVVDLDGAFAGSSVNIGSIKKIRSAVPNIPLQVGGGIRTKDALQRLFDLGIDWCILGTRALESSEFCHQMAVEFHSRVMLGIDVRDGMVATNGWAQTSSVTAAILLQEYRSTPLAALIYTDINRDGMLSGVNVESTQQLAAISPFAVIASGGIKDLDDIRQLATGGLISGAITGRAIYTGTLDLEEAQQMADKQKLLDEEKKPC